MTARECAHCGEITPAHVCAECVAEETMVLREHLDELRVAVRELIAAMPKQAGTLRLTVAMQTLERLVTT